jgi:hypothetical protein
MKPSEKKKKEYFDYEEKFTSLDEPHIISCGKESSISNLH